MFIRNVPHLRDRSKRMKLTDTVKIKIDNIYLSKDIMSYIFTYLDMESMIKGVFPTCRYWQDVFCLKESWVHLNINKENVQSFKCIQKYVENFTRVEIVILNSCGKLGLYLPRLKILTAIGCDQLDELISEDSKIPRIKSLTLDECSPFGIKFPHTLETVYIEFTNVPLTRSNIDSFYNNIDSFYNCTNLRRIHDSCKFIDYILFDRPFNFPKLKILHLNYSVDIQRMANLFSSSLQNLQSLSLILTNVDNISILEKCIMLKSLTITMDIPNDYAFDIPRLPKLVSFCLDGDRNGTVNFPCHSPLLQSFKCFTDYVIDFKSFPKLNRICVEKIDKVNCKFLPECKSLKKLIVERIHPHLYNILHLLTSVTMICFELEALDLRNIPDYLFKITSLKLAKYMRIINEAGNYIKETSIGNLYIKCL